MPEPGEQVECTRHGLIPSLAEVFVGGVDWARDVPFADRPCAIDAARACEPVIDAAREDRPSYPPLLMVKVLLASRGSLSDQRVSKPSATALCLSALRGPAGSRRTHRTTSGSRRFRGLWRRRVPPWSWQPRWRRRAWCWQPARWWSHAGGGPGAPPAAGGGAVLRPCHRPDAAWTHRAGGRPPTSATRCNWGWTRTRASRPCCPPPIAESDGRRAVSGAAAVYDDRAHESGRQFVPGPAADRTGPSGSLSNPRADRPARGLAPGRKWDHQSRLWPVQRVSLPRIWGASRGAVVHHRPRRPLALSGQPRPPPGQPEGRVSPRPVAAPTWRLVSLPATPGGFPRAQAVSIQGPVHPGSPPWERRGDPPRHPAWYSSRLHLSASGTVASSSLPRA